MYIFKNMRLAKTKSQLNIISTYNLVKLKKDTSNEKPFHMIGPNENSQALIKVVYDFATNLSN